MAEESGGVGEGDKQQSDLRSVWKKCDYISQKKIESIFSMEKKKDRTKWR